ncbi:UEV domain-containing protein [Pelagophyceae sp. CCMP2097]|nr:UEV domain-containing protein [Pelagophyceae sp. CCMP2097]
MALERVLLEVGFADVGVVRCHLADLFATNDLVDLEPRLGHGGGMSASCLLVGTLSIRYQGTCYHLPVELRLPQSYPRVPPRAFIRPTEMMVLRQDHRHVDSSGAVDVPYLAYWDSRESTLVELCTMLSSVFGEAPPLYSRPAESAAPPPLPPRPRAAATPQPPRAYEPVYEPSVYEPSVYEPPHVNEAPRYDEAPRSNDAPPPTYSAVVRSATLSARGRVTAELQRRMRDYFSEAAIDAELKQQASLRAHKDGVDSTLARVEAHKEALKAELLDVETRTEDVEAWMRDRENEADAPLAYPADERSRQMQLKAAEAAAIEDVLFVLDAALGDESVELDTFLREVRKLSARQFLCKALLHKIEKA